MDDFNDDDGGQNRTGTWMTASAHIITAVIGSGVLSLAWAIAQLGWIAGTVILILFSIITWFTAILLTDCCRDPVTGKRQSSYIESVKSNLGGLNYNLCGVAQYVNLVGTSVGYTITSSISMAAMKRSNCFHKYGHDAGCHVSNNIFMVIFGIIQVVLSQTPNFHKLDFLSILAAVMSFGYSSIGLGLAIAKIAEGKSGNTSMTGVAVGVDVTISQKVWNCLAAVGNIAFAYAFSNVLVEIQDTLKSNPPENRVMKTATTIGISVTTLFYVSCGLLGYAAFGNKAPGNFLTGFGFYDPFWLVDLANLFIIIHLLGAYQVYSQPVFKLVEDWCYMKWPESGFLREGSPIKIPVLGIYRFSMLRLVWRTLFVIVTTVMAMLFPFFNDILGLLGALAFWPLTVYFPIEMHISRLKIPRFSCNWMWLEVLSVVCLIVSLLAAAGSIEGIIKSLGSYKPFNSVS
ncbi:hypothetical protein SLE2022_258940 [Rubroshorea leprosula]